MASNPSVDVYKFICDKIDSVPHLEALVLIFNSRPVGWTCEELASRLYISHEQVGHLLRDLVRMEFVAESGSSPVKYSYLPSSEERNLLMFSIDEAYRQDL